MRTITSRIIFATGILLCHASGLASAATLTARVLDDATSEPLAARIYLTNKAGEALFVQPASPAGSALPYREQWVPMPGIEEKHTTVSEHGFQVELPPGDYTLSVRRGKEYHASTQRVSVTDGDLQLDVRLKRWVNAAKRGWYSGETHVHRRIQELPNVQLAEDLNVSFPVTYWTIKAHEPPGLEPSPLRRQGPSPFGARQDRGAAMIEIDKTHVIYPRNTEYEIFSVGEQRHVLGAVFVLNHRTPFRRGAPPVAPIAELAHSEGALLDLDKHSWPWSMMLVPIAKVDLYELANNSLWKTRFGFRRSGAPPEYMKIETDQGGMTEMGWIQYGLQNYYALLNCGFPLQPTAGTASGVHPVPLGFSRVYVHTGDDFSGAAWLKGLKAGRSFVTTEPMLFATIDDELPGTRLKHAASGHIVRGEVLSPQRITRVEIVVNGIVEETIRPPADSQPDPQTGAFRLQWRKKLQVDGTSWLAVRAFRIDGQRVRFAHTAPWRIQKGDQPLRPRREEIRFLIDNVAKEIERNRDVLAPEALKEFERALEIYQLIGERAR